ncbi:MULTISPECIES: hypothetical protein [unclassified Pseudoclavibacter]|uniref:hypothetical protein n=1 Tax=unclassified Pseudoclavibacter TaxID=2615177 RepID=UPI000CE77F5A|nr:MULTISPECIES: hypothetical protein [unclassified Pseudoclavibacter]PPF34883.1 hypothetical protein C5E05_13565 [Pseudoclavibacter sp. AY1H1]PPG02332.1 hypothetical protein C5E06_07520 [Pseudoclavibacter sp. RFBI5]
MGVTNIEEGVPEGEERWRDEGGSGESTHFHAHGWRPDPVVPNSAPSAVAAPDGVTPPAPVPTGSDEQAR